MLPFGLCNRPATFQRTMGTLLAGTKWCTCLVYLDDILLLFESFGDHLSHFRSVLQRLRVSALKLKPRKCNLCSPSLKYLGHVVSSDDISPNTAKIEAVKNIQAPTTKSGVQSFLGLASYYRKIIRDFSYLALPLTKLTQDGACLSGATTRSMSFKP